MVDRTDFRRNVKIDILDLSKEELSEDFEDAPETIQSGLYKHVYTDEYDTPGGEPFAAMVSNLEFESTAPDIYLLQEISKVAASCHCPFIGFTPSPAESVDTCRKSRIFTTLRKEVSFCVECIQAVR